ncbi:MAG: thiamine pyrophosphate-dependent dehydrogenase E1 component subunit alpha [Sphingobium sp.]|nr:thiamine pyrophosphate-dependent dehydrogenase E1 component subunit alpha [Sphingobium sp.]MCP5398210.1 thiamine pyrophosphate-dependent dehydrogenase E1 component subunit alpha [Sphingomonas sp.]
MQLSREDMLRAYRLMRTIREFEERVFVEFENGNVPGFVHLCYGQEATAVATGMNLTDRDKLSITHRGHGHSIAKGCDINSMMQELYGKSTGLCGGKGGSMHIADLSRGMLGANGIVGGTAPLAVGAALTIKTRGEDGVSVCSMGDGASNQGLVFEALNMAVVLQLPVIFLYENNGWGEGTSHDYAVGSKDIAGRAGAFGLPHVKVDGTDFFAVHEAMREAVERGRSGGGPSVVESVNRRFGGHFVGDPMLYRTPDEREHTREFMDPVKIFRKKVLESNLLEEAQLDEIDKEAVKTIEDAADSAAAAAFPDPKELETDVYVSYY